MILPQCPIPENETSRLEVLYSYQILDTPPDGAFDRVTALVAELLNVPIAIVSLVDNDRIWFKSRHGVEVGQIDRAPGLCASAIIRAETYAIENCAVDCPTLW